MLVTPVLFFISDKKEKILFVFGSVFCFSLFSLSLALLQLAQVASPQIASRVLF